MNYSSDPFFFKVVWESGDDGMVERFVAERGLCDFHGVSRHRLHLSRVESLPKLHPAVVHSRHGVRRFQGIKSENATMAATIRILKISI